MSNLKTGTGMVHASKVYAEWIYVGHLRQKRITTVVRCNPGIEKGLRARPTDEPVKCKTCLQMKEKEEKSGEAT